MRATELTRSGIVDLAYQQELYSTVWAICADGRLLGFTYMPEEGVYAWHEHPLGGSFQAGHAVVESVEVVDGRNGFDQLWLVVKRTIGGTTKRYIERLADPFEDHIAKQDAFFVDCGLTLDDPKAITGATQANPVVLTVPGHGFGDGAEVIIRDVVGMGELNGQSYTAKNPATNTFELYTIPTGGDVAAPVDGTGFGQYLTGGAANLKTDLVKNLEHLEGEWIGFHVDGMQHRDVQVAAGQAQLDFKGGLIHAGYRYRFALAPMPLEPGAQGGGGMASIRRISRVIAMVARTFGLEYGPGTIGDKAIHVQTTDKLDMAPELTSRPLELVWSGGWDRETTMWFGGDHTGPAKITAITPYVTTSER